jgi:RNA polymerase sigma-70 factor (ECF subfamily)
MDSFKPLLITYAYNILGSRADAEDIVQDAMLKVSLVNEDTIQNRKAYLIRTVINLSINHKKRQKKLLAGYPGDWLPEPVATENADGAVSRKEVLSYSLMVLLEKLNARQRAVFILKEAFDYEHDEIAGVLGITEANSRQLLSRARTQLQAEPSYDNRQSPAAYLDKYMQAILNGDVSALEHLLTDDITAISDGGGKATAAINRLEGRKSVIAFVLGLQKKFGNHIRMEQGEVNHQPALFLYDGDVLVTCQVFAVTEGHTHRIFFMRNPDKLSALQKK